MIDTLESSVKFSEYNNGWASVEVIPTKEDEFGAKVVITLNHLGQEESLTITNASSDLIRTFGCLLIEAAPVINEIELEKGE